MANGLYDRTLNWINEHDKVVPLAGLGLLAVFAVSAIRSANQVVGDIKHFDTQFRATVIQNADTNYDHVISDEEGQAFYSSFRARNDLVGRDENPLNYELIYAQSLDLRHKSTGAQVTRNELLKMLESYR